MGGLDGTFAPGGRVAVTHHQTFEVQHLPADVGVVLQIGHGWVGMGE